MFCFTEDNIKIANSEIAKYPSEKQKSAVMGLLYIAQKQNNNWLSNDAIQYVAKFLNMPITRVYEIATFYTMYNLKPVGKYLIQICCTTPCMLRNSDDILEICKEELGISIGETTDDNMFTLMKVECLGACANAPAVQINELYYEDLTNEKMLHILKSLRNGNVDDVVVGSQSSRRSSEPQCISQNCNK